MIDVASFVRRLGDNARMAELCSVSLSAVSKWRQANRIPDRHYLRVREEARRLELPFEESWFRDEPEGKE